jgi:transcriptional regulator with XRE-family HTH domain
MKLENAAKNIKKYLESEEGMNQKKLAKKSHITQAGLSLIISGDRIPTVPTVFKLLKTMDLTFEELFK